MNAGNPLLSVIIPTYNVAEYVTDALASVCRQHYSPIEIIVIDDGSTDESAQIIEKFRRLNFPELKYTYQSNRGPAAARNSGLALAGGEIIAFLDADDLWPDDILGSSVEYLINNNLQLVVGCTQRVCNSGDGGGGVDVLPFGVVWMVLSLGAAIFRREVFETVGMFDEQLRFGEDVDWFLRAREAGINIEILNEVTRFYRKHDRNMTLDTGQSNHYFLAALHKSLQRRKVSDGRADNLSEVPALSGKKLADFQPPSTVKGNREND